LPKYNSTSGGFECDAVTFASSKISRTTIFEQISGFGSLIGLIFNVTFYGVTSKFKLRTTYIIDDLLILTSFITPITSWFFSTKILYTLFYVRNGQPQPLFLASVSVF
ncbi:10188_t:CDS:1, partial [Cetraspora pellucida]